MEKKMKINPLFNELLIEPKNIMIDDKKTKLLLLEENNNIWVQAIVHAVGPGLKIWGTNTNQDMSVKEGDIILITKELVQEHLKLPQGFIDSPNHMAKFFLIKETEVKAIIKMSTDEIEKLKENDSFDSIIKETKSQKREMEFQDHV
jgi:co-chaperonin GroES (HSP10)